MRGRDPVYPVPATIGVVLREGRVLLVRRANPPDAGKWGFPGGKIEWGESIAQAAEREIREETGIVATARRVFTAVDCMDGGNAPGGPESPLRHFVLVAVLCDWVEGEPDAGDDALEARWFSRAQWQREDLALSLDVPAIISLAEAEARNAYFAA